MFESPAFILDYFITIYSAMLVGLGMGMLSSSMPLRWNSIAGYMFCSTSFFVFPVATQPSRSGEYAEYFFSVFSITIRK